MKITKELLQSMRVEIDSALAAIGKKHSVTLKTGNATFSELAATYKLEVGAIGEDGKAYTRDAATLVAMLPSLGLKPEHLNQVFKLAGHACTLEGYNNRAREKPFIVVRLEDGKKFIFSSLAVKRALGVKDWETENADHDRQVSPT